MGSYGHGMQRGPIDVMAMAFPTSTTPDQMAQCVRQPVETGLVRLVDLVFLLRDGDGTLAAVDIEHERFSGIDIAGMTFDAHTLLSDTDLELLAASLAPDEHGMAVVVEHSWAADAKSQLDRLGAELTLLARIPEAEVSAAYAAEDDDSAP